MTLQTILLALPEFIARARQKAVRALRDEKQMRAHRFVGAARGDIRTRHRGRETHGQRAADTETYTETETQTK